jgi:AcrR family transcriptional regulator
MWYMAAHEGEDQSPRDRLLADAISYMAAHGTSNVSLRGLASAIGTSHRMLIYHFGSKEGLLVEVVKAIEARQREVLSQFIESDINAGIGHDFWRQVSDRRLHPFARLFFEVYGQALQHRSWAEPLLDGVVDDWVAPVAAALTARGVAPQDASSEARLAVAVARGLLLDLLATGDRRAVDAAAACFFDRYTHPSQCEQAKEDDRNARRRHR